jgi:hypothetical protein
MAAKKMMIKRSITYLGLVTEFILRKRAELFDEMKIVRGGMGDVKRAV